MISENEHPASASAFAAFLRSPCTGKFADELAWTGYRAPRLATRMISLPRGSAAKNRPHPVVARYRGMVAVCCCYFDDLAIEL
jgi:hypothetical protein